MLLKTLLTILLLSSITSCKTAFPPFPQEIKSAFYLTFDEVMDIEGNPLLIAHCFSYELVSTDPFKLGDPIELNPKACEGLLGFHPKEMNKIFKWGDSVRDWSERNCK